MIDRCQFLRGFLAAAGTAASLEAGGSVAGGRASLGSAARASALLLGNLADHSVVPQGWNYDRRYSEMVLQECTMLMGPSFTPRVTRKSRNVFDFSTPDREIAFALRNDKAVAGGYFADHGQTPRWVDEIPSPVDGCRALQEIVRTTVTRYAGKMRYWIVANEAIYVFDGSQNGFRNCSWHRVIGGDSRLGTDYVTLAFREARQADPGAKLYYNDYGLENDDKSSRLKRVAVLNLLKELKDARLCDGLGIQGHLFVGKSDEFVAESFSNFLASIADLGLSVAVTELDVNDAAAPADINQRDALVSKSYAAFLEVVLKCSALDSINFWGLDDKYSWYNQPWFPQYARKDGMQQRPDLFDSTLHRKPAYEAVMNVLTNVAQR